MIKITTLTALLIIGSIFHSGCATICGGSKYNANIVVNNNPRASIFYKGREIGKGKASVLTHRKDANKFSFSVKEENCEEEKYHFNSRTFRGWAMVGSAFSWTILVNGIPLIPVGLIVDLSNGSLWKPNVFEQNITKQNYKNFKYSVNYTKSCAAQKNISAGKSAVIYLKNGNLVKGTIIEQIPGKSLQIRVPDGDIIPYSYEEVERIEEAITDQE